jgi:hypothetical protein
MTPLPPAGRSRLSPPPSRAGHAAARPGLVEFLRQLSDETFSPAAGRKLRCGLVATPWQLQQSLSLLAAERPGTALPQLGSDSSEQVVALVLDTSLSQPCCGALATWWLRRDGLASVQQHEHFQHAAEALHKAGHVFANIEAQALCRQTNDTPGVLQALLNAVTPTLQAWGVSHLTVSCAQANAMRLRTELGFEPVKGPIKANLTGERILLHRDLSDLYAAADDATDAAALRA